MYLILHVHQITNCHSNAIDLLCSGQVPKSGIERDDFNKNFETVPELFTPEEKEEWLKSLTNVCVSSDAFFPFSDNVYRLSRSGVKFAAAPTGSVNDQAVLDASEQLGITFIQQPIRLFHH